MCFVSRLRAPLAFVGLLALFSCRGDAPVGPAPRPAEPAQILLASGDGQSAVVGAELGGALVAKVASADGRGVRGVAVEWTVSSGGGSVSAGTSTTDAAGEARTRWTLGTRAGSQAVIASVQGVAPVRFAAIATAGAAARLEKAAGDAQRAVVGAPLPDSLAVSVMDAHGNPVPRQAVAWRVAAGAGTLGAAQTATDTAGASWVRLTLGSTAGEVAVEAAVAGLAGSPVTFRATATAGAAAALAMAGGDGQSGTAGAVLAAPVSVRVTDTGGNPVAGIAVTWRTTVGDGSLSPAIAVSDAAGLAQAVWTLGTTAGANAAQAAAAGSTVAFSATGVAGPAASIARAGGDGQSATAGDALPAPLVVRVTDVHGNAVRGAAVSWVVTGGGGGLSTAGSATDGDGLASTRWTLGPDAGANSVTASVGGRSVSFGATAAPAGSPTLSVAGGDGQSGTVGSALPAPLVVRLADGRGRPIAGAAVAWSATAGGGSLAPVSSTTDAAGEARSSWTLGTAAGANAAAATANGMTVTFSARGDAGRATTISAVSGGGQSAAAGSPLPAPLVVRVTDAHGNPAAGQPLAWTVVAGGGTLAGASVLSGPDGLGRATWTLGNMGGTHRVEVRADGLAGSPVLFEATASAAAGWTIAKVSGDNQTGTPGQTLPASFVVRVTDAAGAPVRGGGVAWTVTGGGGTITDRHDVTSSSGEAAAMLRLGPALGVNTVTATAGGATVTFTATGALGSPAAVAKFAGDGQSNVGGFALRDSLAVRVTDAHGNPVVGRSVAWGVTSGGGSVSPEISSTNASGVARTRWTLGAAEGAQGASATVTGSGLAAAAFSATATPAPGVPVASVTIPAGSLIGIQVAGKTRLTATPRDAAGNPLPGRTIVWSSSDPRIATVDGDGWVTGIARGHVTITADCEGKTAGARFAVVTQLDFDGPLVRGFAHSPVAVDVSSAPATVSFTLRLVDEGYGASRMSVNLHGPGDVQRLACAATELAGGTRYDGTWKCDITLPAGAPAGDWYVGSVSTADAFDYKRHLSEADLRAAGYATRVQVTSAGPDASAPTLAGFSVSRPSVDASAGDQAVELSFLVRDAGSSGAAGVSPVIDTPAGQTGCSAVLAAGTAFDGTWRCTVTVPRGSPAGSWTVRQVELRDGASNLRTVTRAEMQAAGYPAGFTVAPAGPDVAAPSLLGYAYTPAAVDVSSAPAVVSFTLRVSDAGVGVNRVGVQLHAPGDVHRQSCLVGPPVSGTRNDGTWKCDVEIPVRAAAGEWYVRSVFLADELGNERSVTQADLGSSGYSTRVQVASAAPDTHPPFLAGFAYSPAAVDVTKSPATVVFTLRVTDEGVGVDRVGVQLHGPTGVHRQSCLVGSPESGTRNNGAWRCEVTIPTGVEGGRWSVWSVFMADQRGNERSLSQAALEAQGYSSTTVQVTSPAADTDAPVLRGFSLAPAAVDVRADSADVVFTVSAADAGAGIDRVGVQLRSPTGVHRRSCLVGPPTGGTAADGSWTCTVTIPPSVEGGEWSVSSVFLADRRGNERSVPEADLRAAGYATRVTVTS